MLCWTGKFTSSVEMIARGEAGVKTFDRRSINSGMKDALWAVKGGGVLT